MPGYKGLQGVAHDIGHSFTSLMNYAQDDYVMGHILRFARSTGRDTLTIDFISGEAYPAELLQPPISEVPARYITMFWDLVDKYGSAKPMIQEASLSLRYDLRIKSCNPVGTKFISSPYTCDIRITDVRGKEYSAHFAGSWYPEI